MTFDVEPERGFTETYWWRETALEVADYFEKVGDGPVLVWAVADGRRTLIRGKVAG
ncbi:MAG TPA: hypothetical protein VIG24_15240 [Acidimicrobiia bacterium]